MALLKKYYRFQANSILESVIALTIISVCLYFSIIIFARVYTPSTSIRFYTTQNKANELFFLKEIRNDSLLEENENFQIEEEVLNNNLKKIYITSKDSAQFKFKKIFYVQNNSQ
ncbi:hypothetical protein OIU80_11635 [Flavobacterium sp. LS1R47]|uniref:Uncharacterized protein n=1 Tax=Flavobacterium frigoritolerans TaxID=2987686 RepID=A0A9X2ZNE0_9FLAO|nr:hypothetical protein [Flavobacterium frigoritolerans]MCV9932932.1 hypothetical protein [Flavobacterium frigoritolerans]